MFSFRCFYLVNFLAVRISCNSTNYTNLFYSWDRFGRDLRDVQRTVLPDHDSVTYNILSCFCRRHPTESNMNLCICTQNLGGGWNTAGHSDPILSIRHDLKLYAHLGDWTGFDLAISIHYRFFTVCDLFYFSLVHTFATPNVSYSKNATFTQKFLTKPSSTKNYKYKFTNQYRSFLAADQVDIH